MIKRSFVLFLQPVVLNRLVVVDLLWFLLVRVVWAVGMISVVRVVRGFRLERMRLGFPALGR
jgi:hypothetical protein